MKKFALLTLLFVTSPAAGEIIAHKFAPASTKQDIYNLTVPIDITTTNWVAWNTAPSLTGGLLGPASVKPEMYTTVANPSMQIDARSFNDVTGPRAVLFGDAATTPDVSRIEGDTVAIYDEGGVFNGVFNQSGNYWFEFYVRDLAGPVFHGDLWLLVDVDTDPPPVELHYWGEEQVSFGNFEGVAIGKFEIASYGKWDGAAAQEDGAAKFVEDGSLIQYVNVRHLKDQIDAGLVTAVASDGGVYAHVGNPVPYQPVSSALGGSTTTPLRLPSGSEFLQLKIDGTAGQIVDDVSLKLYLDGDYNNDGIWSASDLDFLSEGIRNGSQDWRLDLSNNGTVTLEDRRRWIEDLVGSHFGDANLDGSFDSGDFVTVFQGGLYETSAAAGWEAGDFSGDALFDSSDLTLALSLGAYEEGGAAAHAVPEPTNIGIFLIISLVCWRQRHVQHSARR